MEAAALDAVADDMIRQVAGGATVSRSAAGGARYAVTGRISMPRPAACMVQYTDIDSRSTDIGLTNAPEKLTNAPGRSVPDRSRMCTGSVSSAWAEGVAGRSVKCPANP